jgi:hypothetical protein
MLFSVGYATRADDTLVKEIIDLKDGINEVYFSWGKTPSGRNDQTRNENLTPWEAQAKQIEDLKTLHKAGLQFNLLFNANCYGDKAQSRSFFESVGETVEYVGGKADLYEKQIRLFRETVESGTPDYFYADRAVQVQEIVDRIYKEK